MSNVKIYGGVSYDEERIILREYYEKTQGMTTGAAVNVEISSYRDRLERMQEQYAELKLAAKEEKEADGGGVVCVGGNVGDVTLDVDVASVEVPAAFV